jgi:D-glycero-alpha-D-manno-heptose 1-phosphate guanylyltransferase
MQTVVLAGGLGTRLKSLLGNRPKPMASIANRPFLEYLLLQLKKYKMTEIILCVGYQGEFIQKYFGDGERWGLSLLYSYEQELCGTAGALKLAQGLTRGDSFLVLNGDSFFDIDLKELILYHQKKKALATLALAQVDNTQRYGIVKLDHKGQIVGFWEKMKGGQASLINGGISVFQSEVLKLIPEGRPISLEHEIFPKLIGKGFYGFPFQAYFIDIGVPEDYLRLQADPSRLLMAVGLQKKGG